MNFPGTVIILSVIGAMAWMGWLFWTAPQGYEDSTGFHLGEPDEHADSDNWGV